MANTLDCDKVEAIVAFDISANLTVCHPWAPFIDDVPAEVFDPLLGTICWNCTIGVTRVEHHSVLALEDVIDPDGTLGLTVVLEFRRAFFPDFCFAWDVEGLTCLLHVHVIRDEVSKKRAIDVLKMLNPWGVLLHGVTTLVGSFFAINDGGTIAGFVLKKRTWPVDSVEIIPVEFAGELLVSGNNSVTLWTHLFWKDIMEGIEAAFILPFFQELLWNDIEVSGGGSK